MIDENKRNEYAASEVPNAGVRAQRALRAGGTRLGPTGAERRPQVQIFSLFALPQHPVHKRPPSLTHTDPVT